MQVRVQLSEFPIKSVRPLAGNQKKKKKKASVEPNAPHTCATRNILHHQQRSVIMCMQAVDRSDHICSHAGRSRCLSGSAARLDAFRSCHTTERKKKKKAKVSRALWTPLKRRDGGATVVLYWLMSTSVFERVTRCSHLMWVRGSVCVFSNVLIKLSWVSLRTPTPRPAVWSV